MRPFVAVTLILASQVFSAYSQNLLISDQDLKIPIQSTLNFTLHLDQPIQEEVLVTFDFPPSSLGVAPVNATIPANSTLSYIFTVSPLKVGHANIKAEARCQVNVSTSDAFVRVAVLRYSALEIFSSVVGWVYFMAWSVSFYPQTFSNFKRKSVAGLSFDFLGLNITGFLAYSFFNLGLFFSKEVQREYLSQHPMGVIPVEINDVVFALHATFATLIQIVQCCIYERNGQRMSKLALSILGVIWAGGLVFLVVTLLGGNTIRPWLSFLYYFSYSKLGITVIKYIPQAYFNFRRKSTEGWSIGNILLDFTGGTLSMLQMIVIAYNYDDWESLSGNIPKVGLGLFSILFDVLFMVQHYVLYRGSRGQQNLMMSQEDLVT